ncbi:MAG: ABC transporter substrate-binding protein [Lawsonibacter sp.]|nr:ABC transporter substrate-binding protein [Lawsonibacter sp.]
MKRTLSLLLTAALSLSLMAGCGPKAPAEGGSAASTPGSVSASTGQPDGSGDASSAGDTSAAHGPTPRLMVLSGPTGVGAAKLMANADAGTPAATVEVVTDNSEVQAALVSKDVDIAAIATNTAASLYAQTDGGIQVLAINTLGVLYILEKGDTVHSIADLAGKTLYAPSNTKGANPEHILNHLLEGNGVNPSEVNIEWITPQEITVQMTSSDAGICMLPVPAATALMVQDSAVREAVSLSETWEDLEGSTLPMGCVVARTEYIEEYPDMVAMFLSAYEKSIDYINDPNNLADAAALVAQYGIAPNAKVAEKAIPQCSLTYVAGQEMKTALEDYYTILFQAEPKSIGGGLPYDDFYYGVG